ncbi:MAG TPA: hypothetical protein VMN81_02890 [Vicinamibacterales bacterium]|nr:hypothetical protein [Vicinamibacterales bacterium]
MTRLSRLILAVSAVTVFGMAAGCANKRFESPQAAPQTADEQRVIADFKKRVGAYEGVSSKHRAAGRPSTSELDPGTIHARQKELASRIIKALPEWRQGAIFTPEISVLFQRRIAQVVNGPDGANIKGAIFDDAPPTMTVKVFAEYPTGVPIATVPAQMLELLPVLPKELEYRFLGRHFILMDIAAFLIVDVIPEAIK